MNKAWAWRIEVVVWWAYTWGAYFCVFLLLAIVVWWLWWRLPKRQMRSITLGDPKARADIEDNFRKTIGQALGGIAVVLGAVVAYLQFTQQQTAAHDLLISNQIAKGFEQLGSDKLTVRLGGIYALEGVMKTSPQYHEPVLEALCAFVREGTIGKVINGPPATDIQATLSVIGRRLGWHPPGETFNIPLESVSLAHVRIAGADLAYTTLAPGDLTGADLSHANLGHSVLYGTDLVGTNLTGANLTGTSLGYAQLLDANLTGADLTGANLTNANLTNANLTNAKLTGVNRRFEKLPGANLTGADLTGANLTGADLSGANLTGADLSGANLTGADLSGAHLDGLAQLDRACGKPAHLPVGLALDKPCDP